MEYILDLKLEDNNIHLNLYDGNEFLVLNMKWNRLGEADIRHRYMSIKDNQFYDFDLPRSLKLGDMIKIKIRSNQGVIIYALEDFLESIEFPYYPKVLYFLIVHIDLEIFSYYYYSTGNEIDWDILLNYLNVDGSDFLAEKNYQYEYKLEDSSLKSYSFEELFVFYSLKNLFISEMKNNQYSSWEVQSLEAKLDSDKGVYKLPLVINYLKLSRKGPHDSHWCKNMIILTEIIDKNPEDIDKAFTLVHFINKFYKLDDDQLYSKEAIEIYLGYN